MKKALQLIVLILLFAVNIGYSQITVSTPTYVRAYSPTFGAWMEDPLQTNGAGKIWVIPSYYTNIVYEYTSQANLLSNTINQTYTLPYSFAGTGHVVYGGNLYYNKAGSNNMIKYNFASQTVLLDVPLTGAGFMNTYYYGWGGYSDIDFAVDENGLWVMYSTAANASKLVVSKLNPSNLSITATWNTGSESKNQMGNAFIVDGIVYCIDQYYTISQTINYTYNTNTSTGSAASIPWTNGSTYMTSCTYNPTNGLLYVWNNAGLYTYTTGTPAKALLFDGVNDYVSISNPYTSFNKEITVEWWVNPSANLTMGSGIGQSTPGVDDANSNVWLMHANGSGTSLTFYVNDAGTWRAAGSISPSANSWHHIVGVASASSINIYLDGTLMATSAGISTGINNNPNSVVHFGKDVRYNSGRFGNMNIDEVRIWNRALCQGEILNNMNCELNPSGQTGLTALYHFNQGYVAANNSSVSSLIDASGNSRNGTLYNFTLNGATSNWTTGVASGTCSAFIPPTATITPSGSTTFCSGGSVTLNATSGSGYTYQWKNNNTNISGATGSSLTVNASGNYSVEISQNGCTNTSSQTSVVVNALPTASITASGSTTICSGSSVTLTSSSGSSYLWSNNSTSSSISVSTAGNYSVTITDANGCTATSATTSVSLNTLPSISNCPQTQYQQIYTDSNSCSTQFSYNPTITGSPTPVVTYSFTGATTASGSGTGSGSFFNKGQTTVTVKATNSCGTESCSFVVTVIDNKKPNAITKNITVYLNNAGQASITPQSIDDGSTDNCGTVTLSLSQTGIICGAATENQNLTLNAPAGTLITNIDFASYGTPTGNCGNFTLGSCNSSSSLSVVKNYALNNNSATIPATNGVFGDPCPGTVKRLYVQATWTGTGSSTTFDCTKIGNNTVTLIVTDVNGNVSTANAIVTVVDTIKPNAVAQNVVAQLNSSGIATITAAQVNNGSSDNCGIASMTVTPSSFTCSEIGSNTIILSIIDDNGNFNTDTATVTVQDNVLPTVVTQNVTVNLDSTGNASITAVQIDNGSFDNCGIASSSISKNSFDCSNLGSNSVTLTLTDVNNNSSSSTATVTVKDIIAPTLVCQPDTLILQANGTISNTVNDMVASSFDNCAIVSLTASKTTFTTADAGNNSVTITATDASGNSSICITNVFVVEPVPVAICKNATLYLDANGTASLTANDIDDGSYSLVGLSSRTVSQSQFNCTNVGTNLVWLIVTNSFNKSDSCQATVTVIEDIKPTVITKNITVELDSNGNASISTNDINDGSFDNCSIANLALDKTSFNCSEVAKGNQYALNFNPGYTNGFKTINNANIPIGNNARTFTTWVKADAMPNTWGALIHQGNGDCTGKMFGIGVVNGKLAAWGGCKDWVSTLSFTTGTWHHVAITYNGSGTVSLYLDGSGQSYNIGSYNTTASRLFVGVESTNNGGSYRNSFDGLIDEVKVFNTALTSTQIQADMNGSNPAQANLISYYPFEEGSGTLTYDAVGNNDAAAFGMTSSDWVSNAAPVASSLISSQIVTLTVTDVNGNSNSATANVTVEDNIAPTVLTQNITIQLNASGIALITASQIDNGSTDNCTIDNISVSPSSFDCSNVGDNTVTLTVTDVNGNSSTATATVKVLDNINPTFTSFPSNITVNAQPNDCNPIVTWTEPTASDNCSAALTSTISSGANFPVGTTQVIYTATDPSGNFVSDTFTVTIVPSALVLTYSLSNYNGSNVSCFGSDNGYIDITVNGGCEPYTYIWSNSFTTEDVTGLIAGNYSVTVTDANNTQITQNFVITEPQQLTSNIVSSTFAGGWNVSCFGASNGNADLTVIGGTAPFAYLWSNSATTEDLSGITAGNYSVILTDANGCKDSSTIVLTEPQQLSGSITSSTFVGGNNISCFGNSDGNADLSVTGGTSPYTYLWSNNASTEDLANLSAGTYQVNVTDANGCSISLSIQLTEPAKLIISAGADREICYNTSTVLGDIQTAQGGISPYTYTWTPSLTTSSNPIAMPLLSTTYALFVTDANGCNAIDSVLVTVNPLPVASITASTANDFCNGVTLVANSSTTENLYDWSRGDTTQSIFLTLTNDASGVYTVTVTDSNGCISASSASYTYSPQSLASTYTIIGFDLVKLGENDEVVNGSVGVTETKGHAILGKNVKVSGANSFVKAAKITKHSTATATTITSKAAVTLPTMNFYDPASGSSYSSITVKKNTTRTISTNYASIKVEEGATAILTGNVFGEIEVESNAKVTFTSSLIDIDELKVESKRGKNNSVNTTFIYFSGDATVRVENKVEIEGDVVVNPDEYQVIFYIGSDPTKYSKGHNHSYSCHKSNYNHKSSSYKKGKLEVKDGGSVFNASAYIPEGEIKVEGVQCKNGKTYMNGFFIAEKIESNGKDVVWNWHDCSPIQNNPNPKMEADISAEDVTNEGNMHLKVYPNPFTDQAIVEFGTTITENVSVELYNILGDRLDVLFTGEVEEGISQQVNLSSASLSNGFYYVRMTKGTETIVQKVILNR